MYTANRAPSVAMVSASDMANPRRPFVIKLHAQWCPGCFVTKGVWSQIEETYAGRLNLVVLDFTNEATTAASRDEAKRLGLEGFFAEYAGATGIVVVADGRTRQVRATIEGSRDFAEYRAAIDAALTTTQSVRRPEAAGHRRALFRRRASRMWADSGFRRVFT
jgi:thiol-disulfide isomerase/thioredoxin